MKMFSRRMCGQEKMLWLSGSINTSLENNDNHNMRKSMLKSLTWPDTSLKIKTNLYFMYF